MSSVFVEKCTSELLKLYKEQHEVLYGGQHPLCLNVPCLLCLQKKFVQLQETSGGPIPPNLVSIQTLRDHLARTLSFKLIPDRISHLAPSSTITLSLEPFRALQILHMKRVPLSRLVGLQRLRGQLRVLVVNRCEVEELEEVVVRCGGDNSTSLAWTALKELDISYNRITRLGGSLQYMHGVDKVNFSHNVVGKRPRVTSGSASGSSELDLSGSAAVVTPDLPSHVIVDSYTEGIESIDNVHSLHLGFNKLRQVPHFGSRAKYNLSTLNLRNNELVSIEGVEELDNLVELDLTDNLLSTHSSLKPFHNLHHLSVLYLQGNPVAFHPKHRPRTAEHLSNLIEKSAFKLDGKRLSSAERKMVPTVMTHYVKPATQALTPNRFFNSSINGTTEGSIVYREPPVTNGIVSESKDLKAHQSVSHQAGTTPSKKSRKTHNAVIVDPDDQQPQSLLATPNNGDISDKLLASLPLYNQPGAKGVGSKVDESKEELVVVSKHRSKHKSGKKKKKKDKVSEPELTVPPLLNQEELQKSSDMRKMIPGHWLQGSGKSSSATDDPGTLSRSSSKKTSQSSSLHNTSANSSDILSSGQGSSPPDDVCPLGKGSSPNTSKRGSKRGRRGKQPLLKEENVSEKTGLVEVVLDDCEGTYGPKTSSPDRVSPAEIDGDHYLVERYESDVEDEGGEGGKTKVGGGRDQVLLRISERFLDEIDTDGKCIDRWDLHSLLAVSVESKYWKPSSRVMDVLLLHFNLERRDRSRREYVLMEEGDSQAILDTLRPLEEQNQLTLSMGNKLECLQCQRIFDRAQAKEQHFSSPDLRGVMGSSFNRKSISNLMCPFCHSHILQQSMRSSFKPSSLQNKFHQVSPNNGAAAVADPLPIFTSTTRVRSGFEVEVPEERLRTYLDTHSPRENDVAEKEPLHDSRPSKATTGVYSCASNGDFGRKSQPTFGATAHSVENKDKEDLVNDDNSPVESSYLQDFNDSSLAGNEPSISTSVSDKDYQQQSEAMASEVLSQPRTESGMDPWINSSNKPLNPFNDPDFIRYERNLKFRSQRSMGADSSDGFVGNTRSSSDEEKYPAVFGFGGGTSSISDSGGKSAKGEKDSWIESSNFMDYKYPEPVPLYPPSDAGSVPHHMLDPFSNLGATSSSSVPSQSYMNAAAFQPVQNGHSAQNNIIEGKPFRGHARSNSEDFKKNGTFSSPSGKRKQFRGVNLQESDKSLASVHEDDITCFENGIGNSRRSSMCSGESDSGAGSRSDGNCTANGRRSSHGSSDGRPKGSSSGEVKKIKRQSSMVVAGKNKEGSKLGSKISRVFSFGDLNSGSSPKQKRKNASEIRTRTPLEKTKGAKSSGEGSSGSGTSGRRKSRLTRNLSNAEDKALELPLPPSSSDGGREKRAYSPITIYKDDDPTYIHNSLQLYLDMEILDSSRQEVFKMVFRTSLIRYGEPGEMQVIVVVSNIRAYLFRVVAPESPEPGKWLKLSHSHSLRKLVYIDHGVAYQYLRVEFRSPACYTFLLRDDSKCKLISNVLSLCVADTPGSSLRNVGICVFNIESIRNPDDVLQEVLKSHYGSGKRDSLVSAGKDRYSPTKGSSTASLLLYRLAFRRRHRNSRLSPVTLVVTDDNLFLAKENFAHWPLPRIVVLPPKEALLPPYLDVEQKKISDIQRIILDKEQVKFIVLCFFDETCTDEESCQWTLTLPGAECVTKLFDIVKTRWETDFQTPLPVSYQ